MDNRLVIAAIGKDRPGLIDRLTRMILDSGGNIADSRMTALAGDFAVILLVTGSWDAIARIEDQLPRLAERLDLNVTHRRAEAAQPQPDLLPYAVDVVALDHPGIVHGLAHFFSERGINIQDLSTTTYAAAHTGTPMFAVHMLISVPASQHIASLREEFMDFCDQLNLDAVLEPAKA
ncbi:MAG: glycine cleavage system protein R [Gammaproteobacteria bacterium]|nr:MAG: glycine cleavage system protein R [Gammaproteobacteria bacterium]